jgi:hypothetical protein
VTAPGRAPLPNRCLQLLAHASYARAAAGERPCLGSASGAPTTAHEDPRLNNPMCPLACNAQAGSSVFQRIIRLFRKPCPECGDRALRMHNGIRATRVDEKGRRYPDSWIYEACESCGARFKRFANGHVEVPTDEEWRAFGKPRK